MFTTTLRIPDELAAFLQETAKDSSMSVNAFLAQLLEKERAEARRRRLANDWAAYAADEAAQDVSYAFAAQAECVAEPPGVPYGVVKPPRKAASPRKGRGKAKP